MLRSMYAGVSGLNTHQQMMDVTGNNIANVNTIGFKSSRVTFKEMLSQTLKGASRPSENRAGTNPQQIGLGVGLGSIDNDMSSGNLQSTGKTSDVAIQGDGFFVLQDGDQKYYTRAGNFNFDAQGNLYSGISGLKVLGESGEIQLDKTILPEPTTYMDIEGNLSSETEDGKTKTISSDYIDSKGVSHTLEIAFKKSTTDNQWTVVEDSIKIDGDKTLVGTSPTGDHTISFYQDGALDSGSEVGLSIASIDGAAPATINLDFTKLTQLGGGSDIKFGEMDGVAMGSLESFSFAENGDVIGSYDNGLTQVVDRIALAQFENPSGLTRKDGLFVESPNSGVANVGMPMEGGFGSLAPATLEMSNANLSQEFTNMITAQRGFQASSKLITTSDEMLQELVNLKR
ncbi:flagellar hook protein FlgE [Halanaerobium congolense]|uniref:Flagellar hook protein FlgE n=1 Tax=Halanaerobium congolense TaxID=54121 RepID=A0A1G8I2Y6_9FIRM|nr:MULTISPECIES: flagellar hook protein FlgE [Halanaerobium]PUU87850.1 MAG: flagellar basal-body rod protein FlgF [Halanaerobium sp.]PUU92315.1 MAG: flagellar basal-body rod protein FlgF [Halanaerobium sp.]TDS34727.1 flagellar hook protein FlgE [Halanaerobium congolense]SDI13182.1 flagellar hook protein FlgE [Halanaerobium congolense]SES78046.1 flagellar hook protein FlgE [Halanaerobium congolense]